MRIALVLGLLGTLLVANASAATFRRTFVVQDPIGAPESSFGASLAATAGGDVLIGTGLVNGDGGAVVVDGDTGTVLRTFASPQPNGSSTFSAAVAAAGEDALIAEPRFDVAPGSPTGSFVGAVHRYDAGGGFTHMFLSPTPTEGVRFGRRLAVHGDDLFVVEDGAIHRFDLATNAFVATFPAPSGSDPATFADALLALDGVLVAGDPAAARVFVIDAASGAVVRTISTPVAPVGTGFGTALGTVQSDLLVGAPLAAGGGVVFRVALATGALVSFYEHPRPAPDQRLGWSVGSVGDMVVAGDYRFSLLEDGVADGAVFAFDAASTRLVAILGRGSLDFNDEFGLSLLTVGDRLYAGAPAEDVTTVAAFRVDCGDATACGADDIRLQGTRVDVRANRVTMKARMRMTPSEMLAFTGGSLCLYGTPTPALACVPFTCTGTDRRRDCGEATITRRGTDRARVVARVAQFLPPLPTSGPLLIRLNGDPLTQQFDGTTTRASHLDRCTKGPKRLRCR